LHNRLLRNKGVLMYKIVKDILNEKEIFEVVNYCRSAKFNTKEDHIPLHDPLFSNENVNFDLITYGDLNKSIVNSFIKICNKVQEETGILENTEYGPPILGKSYIARYNVGAQIGNGYDKGRPEDCYTAIFYWGDNFTGAQITINGSTIDLSVGDCIIIPEKEKYARSISMVESGALLMSQFWNTPAGTSPYAGLEYEKVNWGNPLYDKID